jgi:pimeloyl-ACP methyl ester carboxylesterase
MAVDLSVSEYGAGPPLIVLHGLFGSKRNWATVTHRLAIGRRVITVQRHAGGRAAVLGHSMRGKVAMVLALEYPELVERLVVVDIAPARSTGALLAGSQLPDVDKLLFAYRSAWLPHDPDAISFGSTETRASLDALASKMLTAFLASPAAGVQGRVLGVEEESRHAGRGCAGFVREGGFADGRLGFAGGYRYQNQPREMESGAGRGQRRATPAVLASGQRDQPGEEDRDPVSGAHED